MSNITVDCLKKISFSLLPLSEKLEIITRGRPTPNIMVQTSRVSKTKKFLKNFNRDWYDKVKWLCGCETSNALFCFPCLLFGGDTVWTQNGFTNVSKMKEKTGKHQNSRRHLANMISLSLLSQIHISDQITEASEILKTDKQVREYREELSRVVDCLKTGAKFELIVRHDGNTFCNALEDFLSKFNGNPKKHALVFGETSESVQNELLGHMLEVCRQEIVSEVQETSYVAVVCEDVSDISEKVKAIVVLRYEHDGVIRERFWSFLDNKSVDKDGMPDCLLNEIDKLLKKDSSKLIAYTFNGSLRDEGAKIESAYGNAHFVHRFSTDFDRTLRQIASSIKSVRLFFAKLASLDRFFRKSPARLEMLCEYTRELFDGLDVCTVHRVKNRLMKCVEDLASFRVTDKALEAADRFLSFLQDETFLFWLETFSKITEHLKQLYEDIQSGDPSEVATAVDEFCKSVSSVCASVSLGSESSKVLECQEISECICAEMKQRFSFTGHLSAAKLFDRENFEKFHLDLPKADIRETCRAYSDVEEEKLEQELEVFYSLKKFHDPNPLNILNSLNNECELSETVKLLKILVTNPVVSNESEKRVSTVKKVKSLIWDSVMPERLSAFCMISVEEEMVSQIKNFNEKVMQRYCESGNLESSFK